MKKIMCVALSLMLLSAMFVPTFAGDGTIEEMIFKVKEKIEIPAEQSEFSSDIYQYNGITSYTMTWKTPDDYEGVFKTSTVTVNSMGDITRYYTASEGAEKPALPKYSDEEIENISKEWILGVNPSWSGELYLDYIRPDIHSSTVYVNFQRKVNNIPFYEDYAVINVDKESGKIADFYATWNYEKDIPAPDGIISVEEAEAKFKEYSPLELEYRRYKDTDEAKLVYVPKNAQVMIDAFNGSEAKNDEISYTGVTTENAKADLVAASGASSVKNMERSLTPEEQAVVNELDGLLTKEQLAEILSTVENTVFKDMKIQNVSYGKYNEDKYYADITFNSYESTEWNYASARVDAVTGEIIRLSSSADIDSEAMELYKDKTKEIAEIFIKKYAPVQADKIVLAGDEENGYYQYVQQINGYNYDGNYISIRVCPFTGNITSYRKSWDSDITFENPEEIITEDEAAEVIFKKPALNLKYTVINNNIPEKRAVRLVYTLQNGYSDVRAKDGVIVDYSAEAAEEETKIYPSDIGGHYAESYINTLIQYDVLKLEEANFRPDEYITQQEALEMVSVLTHYYTPRPISFETLFEYMNKGDIVDKSEKNSTAILDRQTAAKYIVRALGYKDVAEIKDIFKTGFADEAEITDGFAGYVAIARGLGIVKGNGSGYFNPTISVKRADFAIMIYNYLK